MKPIFVAVDTPDMSRAQSLASAVRDHAGGLKLGLEFFSANGPDGVARLSEAGLPVFLDLKLHDIPNTVAKAVEALAPLRPALLTVHAAGGKAMLAAAKAAAGPQTRVVAVTLLTSLDQSDLAATGVQSSPAEQVERLARLARESGVRRDRLFRSGGRRCPRRLVRWTVRRPGSAARWRRGRRPEARRHSAPGAGLGRIDPGYRPPDYRRRGSCAGDRRHHGRALEPAGTNEDLK